MLLDREEAGLILNCPIPKAFIKIVPVVTLQLSVNGERKYAKKWYTASGRHA